MRICIVAGTSNDITPLVTSCTWSGNKIGAARRLEFSYLADSRDNHISSINIDTGYTVYFFDDNNRLRFKGNIYQIERGRAKSTVNVIAYDNLFVLNKSKSTEKFTDELPEDIARAICRKQGVYTGDIASTGVRVSFIANRKSGYQIISEAYEEAAKSNSKKYQLIMNGDKLDVVEKGKSCGVVADSALNVSDSVYKKSIENIINCVNILDEEGNLLQTVSDDDSIRNYSMFVDVYQQQKDKDSMTEARALMKKPEQEGVLIMLGDYDAVTGYSMTVKDAQFKGKFYIKADAHRFDGGLHTMQLTLEFEG